MKKREKLKIAIPFDSLPDDAYLRVKQLIIDAGSNSSTALLPFSRATLWRMVKARTFPAPKKISSGVTAWSVRAIRQWLKDQNAKSENDAVVKSQEGCNA
ncbi:AlpA family phage regulatory protein [Aquabacterium sp.]|uniref:helix-turn-helix transcriptional regulator n=1 Tax=Aquabacterium sp. TaxID=1872578 RepID=UPI0025B90A70|nr:AlpA family phage regulatory protein [Aquabacterium sp.]